MPYTESQIFFIYLIEFCFDMDNEENRIYDIMNIVLVIESHNNLDERYHLFEFILVEKFDDKYLIDLIEGYFALGVHTTIIPILFINTGGLEGNNVLYFTDYFIDTDNGNLQDKLDRAFIDYLFEIGVAKSDITDGV
jgi:hypothetical protein